MIAVDPGVALTLAIATPLRVTDQEFRAFQTEPPMRPVCPNVYAFARP